MCFSLVNEFQFRRVIFFRWAMCLLYIGVYVVVIFFGGLYPPRVRTGVADSFYE